MSGWAKRFGGFAVLSAVAGACSLACSDSSTDDVGQRPAGSGGNASGSGGSAPGSGGSAPGSGGQASTNQGGAGGADIVPSSVPRTILTPTSTEEVFRNPERGFYRATDIIGEDTLSWIDDEYSLYFSYVRLDDYRETDIPAGFLDQIEEGFSLVRAEGAKLILRFAYNFGPYPDSEPDASLEQMLTHIEQLGPLLRDNADVIATLQAGFIGAWGEWHTSTNELDNVQDKTTVLQALLEELPTSRAIQVRYPPDLIAMYGETPLSADEAWSGSAWSRTAHHNDCFLASERDLGTYPSPTDPEVFKDYLSQHNLYTAMGGETCAVNPPRSECATALREMEQLRFSFINDDYHPDVVASWTSGGCREQMERSLGYRLRVTEVDLPAEVAPGDPFVLRVTIENAGWAAPINPRPVFLILDDGQTVYRLKAADFEARSLLPGSSATLQFLGVLPQELATDEVDVALWLPDADQQLAADPRYAIRLAHEQGWDATTGSNQLGTLLTSPSAPTDAIQGAEEFTSGWQ